MPLEKAGRRASKRRRRKVASDDISQLRREGYKPKQAVAIGLERAGLSNRKKRKGRGR